MADELAKQTLYDVMIHAAQVRGAAGAHKERVHDTLKHEGPVQQCPNPLCMSLEGLAARAALAEYALADERAHL